MWPGTQDAEEVSMDEVNQEKNTKPLVIALYAEDFARLERILGARRASRPEGARKLSRSQLFRDLLREADAPSEMTDEECQR